MRGQKVRVLREAILTLAREQRYEDVTFGQAKSFVQKKHGQVKVADSTFYNVRRRLILERDQAKNDAPQDDGVVALLLQLKAIKKRYGLETTKELLDML